MLQYIFIWAVFFWLIGDSSHQSHSTPLGKKDPAMIKLPEPKFTGMAIETALRARRSIRSYAKRAIQLDDIALLLWAAQGINSSDGKRTAPSAGALYPIEIYLVAGSITGIESGVYLYRPQDHSLAPIKEGDQRPALSGAALDQPCVASAPACLIVAAVYQRTAKKYGDRAKRYVHMEAGHAAENVLLQAVALQLGAVVIGAFDDQKVQRTLDIPADHKPLEIIPLGYPDGKSESQI